MYAPNNANNDGSTYDATPEAEHEQHALLSESFNSSIGLPKKRPRWWPLSLSTASSRVKQLGFTQHRSGGALRWILSVLSLAALLVFYNINREETAQIMGVAAEDLEDKEGNYGVSVKEQQIANYVNGTAIILNIHITHHAGTSLCGQMSKFGHTPGFACMGKGKNNSYWPEDAIKGSRYDGQTSPVGKNGVSYNETEEWVTFWRQYFHYVSLEKRGWGNLHITNWENENLVGTIVMRHPLERFLAGGKCGQFHSGRESGIEGDPTNETQDLYWEYANSQCADNYALRVLTNRSDCAHGADTSISCLESAKDLLSRFTFILDQSCLAESMVALGSALNLSITNSGFESPGQHHTHPPMKDRFGNDTLYEYVKTRFRRDIELYEWSKKRSIVVCNNTNTI